MLESIVTVLVSALMASLSFMVVKWLNSVDDQLHNLEKAYRKIKEEIADVRNQTVRTSEFLKVIHKFEQAVNKKMSGLPVKSRRVLKFDNNLSSWIPPSYS